jgi:hypothetical protein
VAHRAGPVPNGHAESPEAHAKPVNDVAPKTDGGAAEEAGAAAPQAVAKDGGEAAPHPGSQAMRDSQKALEQTLNNLRVRRDAPWCQLSAVRPR